MRQMIRRMKRSLARNLSKSGASSGEEGSTLIEFALTASMFFFLVLGFMQLCYIYFEYDTASCAARDAARWASVRGTECLTAAVITDGSCNATQATIQTFVQKDLPGSATMTIPANGVQWCTVGSTGTLTCATSQAGAIANSVVEVTVNYSVVSWMPGMVWVSHSQLFQGLTLSSTAEHVIWE